MDILRKRLLHLSDIPRDLDEVTTIDTRQEVDPQDVGLNAADVNAIWDNVVKLYRSGVHPGISLSIRHRGKVLLSRGIGHARGNGPEDDPSDEKILMRPDTPVCLYSTSKGITALMMHMLAEDGLINVMDPVAFYAPEFARNGKDNITIHQILAHRGGIPGLPPDTPLDTLWDEDATWDLLCDAEPIITDGSKLAYHAITGGFVLERVVRQVTGDTINAYIDRKIRQPMGMKYFSYGIEREHLADLAPTYATGPRPGFLLRAFLKRALGTGDITSLESMCNDPRFQDAIIPAGNLVGTADETSKFFQMMLDGGNLRVGHHRPGSARVRQPHCGPDPGHPHALQCGTDAGGRALRRLGPQQSPGVRPPGADQQVRLGRPGAGNVGIDINHRPAAADPPRGAPG
jgi:CubicO group peptidase (beta-lactamase class C family)